MPGFKVQGRSVAVPIMIQKQATNTVAANYLHWRAIVVDNVPESASYKTLLASEPEALPLERASGARAGGGR